MGINKLLDPAAREAERFRLNPNLNPAEAAEEILGDERFIDDIPSDPAPTDTLYNGHTGRGDAGFGIPDAPVPTME